MNAESEQILIYEAYPRRVARIAALKAITKAVAHLVKSEKITPLEARRKLYKATLGYARSPAGSNPDRTKIPHPATWYNRGSYLDDPKEWQHGGFSNVHVSTGRADSNLAILAESIRRDQHKSRSHQDGDFQAGEDGYADARKLLPVPKTPRP